MASTMFRKAVLGTKELYCPHCKNGPMRPGLIMQCDWCGECLRPAECLMKAPQIKVKFTASRGGSVPIANGSGALEMRKPHNDKPRMGWLYVIAALVTIGTAVASGYAALFVTM